MSKIKEIQDEIEEFKALIDSPDVPADEKEMARKEIKDLEAELEKLKGKEFPKKNTSKQEVSKKTKLEVAYLKSKGFEIICESDGISDCVFGDIEATQGYDRKTKVHAVCFLAIGDFENISRSDLDAISGMFSKTDKVRLFTNAGVDLHSTTDGKHKNITLKRVTSDELEKLSDKGRSVTSGSISKGEEEKNEEPDCEELLARLKANKKRAKARAKMPKPTAGESIEKAADVAVKKIEAKDGKLSVADKKRIIASFKEIIEAVKTDKEFIKQLIKVLTKMV